MRFTRSIPWLLVASFLLPLASSAQFGNSRSTVSVRDLSIPPRATQDFRKGINRLAKNDAAGSLPYFQRAISLFDAYYEAYFEIGIADLKLSRAAEAEQSLRKSIELSSGRYAEPMFALSALLIQQNKFAEGEKIIRAALTLNPASWAGQYCLGWALLGLNRVEDAEKSVLEALRLKPDSADSYLLLAEIHGRMHEYPKLLIDLNEYRKFAPVSAMDDKVESLREKAEQEIRESENSAALVQFEN